MSTTSPCARVSLSSSPSSSLVPLLLVRSITAPADRQGGTTPGQTQLAWTPASELRVPNQGALPGHVSHLGPFSLLGPQTSLCSC